MQTINEETKTFYIMHPNPIPVIGPGMPMMLNNITTKIERYFKYQ